MLKLSNEQINQFWMDMPEESTEAVCTAIADKQLSQACSAILDKLRNEGFESAAIMLEDWIKREGIER